MRGVDKAVIAVGLATGSLLTVSCILDVDSLLRNSPSGLDGGGGGPASSAASGDSSATSAAGGSGGGGSGGGGSGPFSCEDCRGKSCVAVPPDQALQPNGLAVGGGYLFWRTSANIVRRIKLSAGAAVETVANPAPSPSAITVSTDGKYVLWADQQKIWKCAVDEAECMKNKVALYTLPSPGSGMLVFRGLATDAKYAYWMFSEEMYGSAIGEVHRCPIVEGCSGSPDKLATSLNRPNRIFVDQASSYVYWTVRGPFSSMGGGVYRIPSTTTDPKKVEPIVTGRLAANGLAVVQGGGMPNLYWAEADFSGMFQSPGGVYWCIPGKSSGSPGSCASPTPLGKLDMIPKINRPAEITSDGTSVFWTNYASGEGTGSVMACPIPSCGTSPAKVIAAEQRQPAAIAYDPGSKCLFWEDETDGGRILRTASD